MKRKDHEIAGGRDIGRRTAECAKMGQARLGDCIYYSIIRECGLALVCTTALYASRKVWKKVQTNGCWEPEAGFVSGCLGRVRRSL